jgi:Ni,Fe-hydrogenase III large subunit
VGGIGFNRENPATLFFENLIMGNEIIHVRTKGIGILQPDIAISYGCSGPVAQASGVAVDDIVACGGLPERKVVVNKDLYDQLARSLETARV